MKTYAINAENDVTAFASPEEAAANCEAPPEIFSTQEQLGQLAAAWPDTRLVAIWNSLPGVRPSKAEKLKDRNRAIGRIWERIQRLGEGAAPKPEQAVDRNPADLPFSDGMRRFVAFDGSACALRRPESEARRDALLDESVVLFDDIVHVRRG